MRAGTLEGRNSDFASATATGFPGAAASSRDPAPGTKPTATGHEPLPAAPAPPAPTGLPAKRLRTDADDIFPAMPALKLVARDGALLPFNLLECLGKGTFGSVFAAEIGPANKAVAIKIFEGAPGRINALREALALERCAHPQVIRLLDAWWDSEAKRSFLVMPRCANDLEHHLRSAPGSFTVTACRDLLEALCKGTAWIHAHGLLHTDLKPGNVLLGSVDPPGNFYVADLGCCVEALRPPLFATEDT